MNIDETTTAVITGGSQGIGLGIARALARCGAGVALLDVDDAALARAQAELSGHTRIATRRIDVRDREALGAVAEDIEGNLGPVDLVVANAGVGLGVFQPLTEELTYSTWDYVVGVNLGGVNNTIQTFVPRMIERGRVGHVVTTASAAGLAIFPERSSGYTYHASKFAVIGLTEALRRGFRDADLPLSASVLIPGLVATAVAENSVKLAPADALAPERAADLEEIVTAGTAMTQKYGRDVDVVGDQTLQAVREDQLYILTDRLAHVALRDRTEAIVAAMPAATGYDTGLGDAMKERRAAK